MSQGLHVIVGLGASGLSCAHFLARQGIPFAITDSRATPPGLEEIKNKYPQVSLGLGGFNEDLLSQAAVIVLSPGVALAEPCLQKPLARGVPVVGDIELFAKAANAPQIVITGTNAKSTVTTLVGDMARKAGLNAAVGGNLGVPALDLLALPKPDLYVLELSSFQLETTYSLAPRVATVLNVTPDHMDRYRDIAEYAAVKRHIYSQCEIAVCNRDDPQTDCGDAFSERRLNFTLQTPEANEFGIRQKDGQEYLAFADEILMDTHELPILGRHYQANALAALALGLGFGFPLAPMLETLREFRGLPHRCQWLRERKGVTWYNDSKGTNVGATLAALEGFGPVIRGKLILIAGGLGKNADFSPLLPALKKYVRHAILLGKDAPVLAAVIDKQIPLSFAQDMPDAVQQADQLAQSGDSVLLSPACASLDMFKNFEHRGEVFAECVKSLS